jgi:hypothetical protein
MSTLVEYRLEIHFEVLISFWLEIVQYTILFTSVSIIWEIDVRWIIPRCHIYLDNLINSQTYNCSNIFWICTMWIVIIIRYQVDVKWWLSIDLNWKQKVNNAISIDKLHRVAHQDRAHEGELIWPLMHLYIPGLESQQHFNSVDSLLSPLKSDYTCRRKRNLPSSQQTSKLPNNTPKNNWSKYERINGYHLSNLKLDAKHLPLFEWLIINKQWWISAVEGGFRQKIRN